MSEQTVIDIPGALVQALRAAHSITVLTGAGISAESGIPTFRESQTGLWSHYDPQSLASPEAFHDNPGLVMDWYRWRRELVARARPNPGHLALAAMEARAPGFTLVTQNVDDLHRQAGSQRVIELHGSLRRLRCSSTACGYSTTDWPEEQTPRCPRCGALLRPDVVWFGEAMPTRALEAAVEAARSCDLFFAVGTSAVVEPAASLPYEALRANAAFVEINPQPTPLSVYSPYSFPYPAGVALPQIVRAAWG